METTPLTRRTAPSTQPGSMARIEERLERIEAMLERFEDLAVQAPGLAAMTGDIVDEWASRDGHADERLRAALSLIDRVTQPEVLGALETIVGQLEAAPGLVAMVGDMIDELARQADAQGADLHAATANLVEAMHALIKLAGQPEAHEMLESGAFSPGALRTINLAARAMTEAGEANERVGFFGAMSRMRDPEVQRAVGFALSAAKVFGRGAAELEDEG